MDDNEEITTPATVDTHQIDMFAMSNERGLPENDQDDSQESSSDATDDVMSHGPLNPDTEKIHSRIEAYIEAGGTLPTIEVADLRFGTHIHLRA